MSKKIGVLVFPAGEINSVELHDALATCVNIALYGASSIDKHGEYVFKNYISGLPMISEENFFDEFNKIIEENNIDVVFPTHDTVADFFAENKDRIKANIIVADRWTAEVCRDKKKTYEVFEKESFCPKVYEQIGTYPVFIKPKKGQGSVGAKLIRSKDDITDSIVLSEYVITEYLPGKEMTVDCFTDRHGKLRVVLPRSRDRLLAGISVSAKDEELTDEIKNIADTINSKLNFRGLWWLQLKEDKDKKLKLLEVSTRCAGTMCMARARGVNLALLSVYDALGYEVEVFINPYHIKLDRSLISRYKIDYEYDNVYFDFDDTLIINNKVHLPSISFLYQCKNKGKKIFLITKHETDIYEDLEKYNLPKSLFEEIIWIKPEEDKVDYIKKDRSIFVDNMHAERKNIITKLGIPVFDVDAIEVLMDWRI